MDLILKLIVWALVIGVVIGLGVMLFSTDTTGPVTATTPTYATLPEPTNYAVDTTNTFSAEQLASLNSVLEGLDKQSKVQLAVLVTDTTKPLSIEQYGIELADKWKVGRADLDNGAIIILAITDRKVRIEVGQGLEGDIPDSVAGAIIDNAMLPHLKKGEWYEAVVSGVNALSARIN